MRLINGMIKDMKSRTIVGNCRTEKFFGVDNWMHGSIGRRRLFM